MSGVTRYNGMGSTWTMPSENGDYVKYDDYAELEARCAAKDGKLRMINELIDAAERVNKLAQEATERLIQERNALAAENAALKSNADKARQVIMSSKFDYWSDRGELLEAVRLIDETPSTYAFLAEVRAQAHKEGAHFVANRMLAAWEAGFIEDTAKNAADIARMILTSTEFMDDAPEGDFDRSFADGVLEDIAAQIRKEAAQ